MLVQITDYNHAGELIKSQYLTEWDEILKTLIGMPLHLKASDQAGKQGVPIFDPVGTNQYIKEDLIKKHWHNNIPIPTQYDFLGTDIDFGKRGMLVEVQFSNYPFLLNNTVRSELFYKSGWEIDKVKTKIMVIITKAHMFPSSNSTLYYEQAKKQLDELARNGVFDVPIRLVGLFEKYDTPTKVVQTTYSKARYSRNVSLKNETTCILQNKSKGSIVRRCVINID